MKHLFLILALLSASTVFACEESCDGDTADLPKDVKKYVELAKTCANWKENDSDNAHPVGNDAIQAVGNHSTMSTTQCYLLQVKYGSLMHKYEGQPEITDVVENCYVSF